MNSRPSTELRTGKKAQPSSPNGYGESRKAQKGNWPGIYIICVYLCSSVVAFTGLYGETDTTRKLALELDQEGNHEAAGIEYRRLALTEEDREKRAGYYWAAAYEYWLAAPLAAGRLLAPASDAALGQRLANNSELVAKMLDRAEDDSQALTTESILLRAEAALWRDRPEEAVFYLQSVIRSAAGDDAKALASRRLARAMLLTGDVSGAGETLSASPYDNASGLITLDRYGKERNKRPWLGGILGLIPGLGYAYSGEYANALRSLILNGLFIYGMIDTAGDEEWGAFTAIAFFELTWYSGSIYGGIDAAHRFNRSRLNDCIDAIDGSSSFSVDLRQIPVVSLKFKF